MVCAVPAVVCAARQCVDGARGDGPPLSTFHFLIRLSTIDICETFETFETCDVCAAPAALQVEIISDLPAEAVITCYRVGPMVDLCTGPHVPNTGLLKAVGVNAMSRAFWRADVAREPLQRVYAITFPDDKELKDYQHRMAEAKKRDHRNVGTQQVGSGGGGCRGKRGGSGERRMCGDKDGECLGITAHRQHGDYMLQLQLLRGSLYVQWSPQHHVTHQHHLRLACHATCTPAVNTIQHRLHHQSFFQ